MYSEFNILGTVFLIMSFLNELVKVLPILVCVAGTLFVHELVIINIADTNGAINFLNLFFIFLFLKVDNYR